MNTRPRRVGLRPDEDEFARAVRRIERRDHLMRRVAAVGWLHVGLASLGMVAGLALFAAIAPWGFLAGDPSAALITSTVGTVLGGSLIAISLPGFVAGVGLLRGRPWARNVAMIVSALLLFQVPVGTVLGALSLYVLLQDDTRALLEAEAAGEIWAS